MKKIIFYVFLIIYFRDIYLIDVHQSNILSVLTSIGVTCIHYLKKKYDQKKTIMIFEEECYVVDSLVKKYFSFADRQLIESIICVQEKDLNKNFLRWNMLIDSIFSFIQYQMSPFNKSVLFYKFLIYCFVKDPTHITNEKEALQIVTDNVSGVFFQSYFNIVFRDISYAEKIYFFNQFQRYYLLLSKMQLEINNMKVLENRLPGIKLEYNNMTRLSYYNLYTLFMNINPYENDLLIEEKRIKNYTENIQHAISYFTENINDDLLFFNTKYLDLLQIHKKLSYKNVFSENIARILDTHKAIIGDTQNNRFKLSMIMDAYYEANEILELINIIEYKIEKINRIKEQLKIFFDKNNTVFVSAFYSIYQKIFNFYSYTKTELCMFSTELDTYVQLLSAWAVYVNQLPQAVVHIVFV